MTDSSRAASSRIDFCSARGRSARMVALISFAGSTARRSRRRVAVATHERSRRSSMSFACARTLRSIASNARRAVGLAGLLRAKGVGPGEDRVQRRPQLVRDQGQELVLGPVGRLGGLPRLVELARSLRLQGASAQHGEVGGQLRRDHRERAHVLLLVARRRRRARRGRRSPRRARPGERRGASPASRALRRPAACSSTSWPRSAAVVAVSAARSAGGVSGAVTRRGSRPGSASSTAHCS